MPEVDKFSHKIPKKLCVKIPHAPKALDAFMRKLTSEGALVAGTKNASRRGIKEISAYFNDEKHFQKAMAAVKGLKGYEVLEVQDAILDLHKGGKIEIKSRARLKTLQDLRTVYTPGVAHVCHRIVAEPALARKYTWIGNTVCIATNGSAVLGLGDIGVLGAMPVMEGKSVILKEMGNVSCVPLLIKSDDATTIINTLASVAETFGTIMIEDIKAPLCFEVEQALQEKVKIPVFHDDQHGTATVVLAALIRALTITGKKKDKVNLVINGAGAAGIAITKLLLGYGFKEIILCDRVGAVYKGRTEGMNRYKEEIAVVTNSRQEKGTLKEVLKGKDIFIGVSGPGLVNEAMIKSMNKHPIVFALANPVPEIWPKDALKAGAALALDGKTINNALAFPGIIRGTLDANASRITDKMKVSAAEMIASLARKKEVVPDFLVLTMHEKVAKAVAAAAKTQT